jgi:hypothetical protein
MYDLIDYDQYVYDADSQTLDFRIVCENKTTGGDRTVRGANYLDYRRSYQTYIASFSDNSAGELARDSTRLYGYAVTSITRKEEVVNKTDQPSQYVIYGVTDYGERVPIMVLTLTPFNYNLRGRASLTIGDYYATGELVDQGLEDEYDASPVQLRRQVLRYTFYDYSGYHEMEYAGTPRQIINYLIGGLPFAKDILVETQFSGDSVSGITYDEDTIDSEKSTYSDGRLSPGAYFNSLWYDYYDNSGASIIALAPMEIEFIDSNNAPIYSLIKSAIATLDVLSQKIFRTFDSFFVKTVNLLDYNYWIDILDTKIFKYSYQINKTTTVTRINYDPLNQLESIEVGDATRWPDFAMIFVEDELVQYTSRNGDTLYINESNRHIDGTRNMPLSVGMVVKLRGDVRLTENQDAFRSRLTSLMGAKETTQALNDSLQVLLQNSESATGEVFDFHSYDYLTSDKIKWAFPKREIGWFAGGNGDYSLKSATCSYVAATKTLTLSALSDPIYYLTTGDTAHITYGGDDEVTTGYIYSIDASTYEVVLIDNLLDSDGVALGNFSNAKVCFYALGSAQTRIKESDIGDAFNFEDETILNHSLETLGYFHNTQDIETIYYETAVNESETTLSGAIAAEDTTSYDEALYNVLGMTGTNRQYNYTGKVKSYSYEPFVVHALQGRYPFIVRVNDWNFNNQIITETINSLKAVGTTPNYVINKDITSFRTTIGSDKSNFVDLCIIAKNE